MAYKRENLSPSSRGEPIGSLVPESKRPGRAVCGPVDALELGDGKIGVGRVGDFERASQGEVELIVNKEFSDVGVVDD